MNKVDGHVKRVYLEAGLKAVKAYDDLAFMEQLKPYYDPERLQSFYEIASFQAMLEMIRRHFYTGIEPDMAYLDAGRKTFYAFYEGTIVGSVALAAIKIMSPTRLMTLGSRMWQDTGLGETQFAQLDVRKFRTEHRNFAYMPHGVLGITTEGLKTVGAKNLRYQLEQFPSSDPNLYNFDIIFVWD